MRHTTRMPTRRQTRVKPKSFSLGLLTRDTDNALERFLALLDDAGLRPHILEAYPALCAEVPDELLRRLV